MPELQTVESFLGWCSLINVSFLMLASLAIIVWRGPLTRIHNAMFGINAEQLGPLYFTYLGHYKLLIIVFNLIPYLVLRLL